MTQSTCWPDYELTSYVSAKHSNYELEARWRAELLDVSGVPAEEIIPVNAPFDIRFRVEVGASGLVEATGDWTFDVLFESIGMGAEFMLSSKLPPGVFAYAAWDGSTRCIEHRTIVPATTVEQGVYALLAMVEYNGDAREPPLVDSATLGQRQWY